MRSRCGNPLRFDECLRRRGSKKGRIGVIIFDPRRVLCRTWRGRGGPGGSKAANSCWPPTHVRLVQICVIHWEIRYLPAQTCAKRSGLDVDPHQSGARATIAAHSPQKRQPFPADCTNPDLPPETQHAQDTNAHLPPGNPKG